jgi:uncharacterized protein (TIGR02453 family)
MEFTGFPDAALDFYEDLEMDNSKSFWLAHKAQYDEAVAVPMKALCAALADEFGMAKVFRPYRDVRFSKDKTPYKTHQGAYVAVAPATGWYVQISAAGLRTGGGFYEATPTRLAALRQAIDNEHSGTELEQLVARYVDAGWLLGGEQVRTAPRGYDKEHPRIALLRHKTLTLGRDHGFDGLDSPAVLDWVGRDWRDLRPFIDYLTRPDVLSQ